MLRKIFKSGNSIVVSLPKEYLDELKLKDGTEVAVTLDNKDKRIVISPVEQSLSSSGVDEEFAEQLADFIEQYRPALEALAGE